MSNINTHNKVVDFGKHTGELWTRIPISYLRWMVNQPAETKEFEKNKKIAQAELDRRGVTLESTTEVSSHAVDRASLRIRHIWHQNREHDEGLHSWLQRTADEAIEQSTSKRPKKVEYLEVKWVFKWGDEFPILLTVMPA